MKLALILLQLLGGLTLIPWPMIAGMSFMAFDAPDSTKKLLPYLIVGIILSYPIILLFCYIMSWWMWSHQHTVAAFIWSAAPFLLVGGFLLIAFW
jgi:hypothetical protein